MLLACEAQRRLFGVVEVDESFFGARRLRQDRRLRHLRAAGPRLYRDRPCSKPTLQGIIRGRVDPRTVINSDGWRGYHGLVDLGYGHVRVDHVRDEFTKGTVHINGIEGFWGLAKVRLTKFKGLPKHTFHLHLKETEWRYNHRRADKYKCLLQYLRPRVSTAVPPCWSARPLSGPGRLMEIGCSVVAPAPRADPVAREAVR